MRWMCLPLLCALPLMAGCGGSSAPTTATAPQMEQAVSTDELKKLLEQMSQTGEAGSAAMGLRPTIEELNKQDPAKGGPLLKDLKDLEGATSPDKIKTIAKKMASQL